MSARFEVGELVDITIRGARVSDRHVQDKHLWLGVDGDAFYLPVRMLANATVTVSHAAPKEWPPQPGDVWVNAHGAVLFASGGEFQDQLWMRDATGNVFEQPATALEHMGPLKLDYRQGWSPAPEPAGPRTADEPVVVLDERAEAIAGFRELADFLEAHPDVPFDRYARRLQIHVSNQPHMRGKDEPAMFDELARIAGLLGVDADLRDEPDAAHPHATRAFRGGVQYQAVYVTKAYKRGYQPETAAGATPDTAPAAADEPIRGGDPAAVPAPDGNGGGDGTPDIAQGVGEVAGPDGWSGPATAPSEPERPVVLVASPVAGQPPVRAEVWEDKPGARNVKVVYCDSRTGARVARRRILGLDTGGAYTAEFLHGPAVSDVLDAPHPDERES